MRVRLELEEHDKQRLESFVYRKVSDWYATDKLSSTGQRMRDLSRDIVDEIIDRLEDKI